MLAPEGLWRRLGRIAPLAAPAALNFAYLFHSRRAVGWTILGVTVAANLALLVGSLVFLARGQSFEQSSEMGESSETSEN